MTSSPYKSPDAPLDAGVPVRSHLYLAHARSNTVIATILATLFLAVECFLLLFPGSLFAAPERVVEFVLLLFRAFFLPITISSYIGVSLDQTLLLSSSRPIIKVAPELALCWLFWALFFFLLLTTFRGLRRAA